MMLVKALFTLTLVVSVASASQDGTDITETTPVKAMDTAIPTTLVSTASTAESSSLETGETTSKLTTNENTTTVRAKKNRPVTSTTSQTGILQDESIDIGDVPVEGESTGESDGSLMQPVSSVNKDLAEWVKEGNWDEIEKFRQSMNDDEEFSKQLCPLITTFEQYQVLSERFRDHGMGPMFFVHGDIEIVKKAVAEERRYDDMMIISMVVI